MNSEILIITAFAEIVHSSNGTMHKAEGDKSLKNDNLKNSKTNKRREKKNVSIIPAHLMKTDISGLKGESLIFANTMFCILFLAYFSPPTLLCRRLRNYICIFYSTPYIRNGTFLILLRFCQHPSII
jgi:hypothetical protein